MAQEFRPFNLEVSGYKSIAICLPEINERWKCRLVCCVKKKISEGIKWVTEF